MRATMLLSATSNGVGVNVRLVGYGLSISRYQGIYIFGVREDGIRMGDNVVKEVMVFCMVSSVGVAWAEASELRATNMVALMVRP